jgi:hypothetical protein
VLLSSVKSHEWNITRDEQREIGLGLVHK